ncbi:pseudouridine synthase [Ornithinibacillus sp. 4-3]|uniref:Pseudouridine synthase n=1 Tax=Ornithinibacillus sp. 4-3 TaxID=3231488 RepID=A0AB39HJF6_9BACI
MTNQGERLQKVIAHSGITSRRKAEQLILEGKVKVNSTVVKELGTKVSRKDVIEVNGIPIEKEKQVYFILHKPRGVISAVSDDKGREVVTDLLPGVSERIFPIGRLDYQTTGLLLLTNDGEFANQLMHPKHQMEKVYVTKIKGIPSKEQLNMMIKGVKVDKDLLKAKKYKVMTTDKRKKTMLLEITLTEGKNRHIRRMMEHIGFPVLKLKREKYGPLTLDGLNPGQSRPLTLQEKKTMNKLILENVDK